MTRSGNHRPPQQVILCIEDEPDLRRDIADELSEAGYEVVEAQNGLQALDLLETSNPDLILCDISMPGLNGYDVLNAIRKAEKDHSETPFVFLSALGDSREVIQGKRLGADDYLVKPVDFDLLLATVEARLRQIARIRAAKALHKPILDAAALSELFGLTATEARVALALTEGNTLAQIARTFGVSRTTVAYHLRNIFQKTGVSRQTELVSKLLGGIPPEET